MLVQFGFKLFMCRGAARRGRAGRARPAVAFRAPDRMYIHTYVCIYVYDTYI